MAEQKIRNGRAYKFEAFGRGGHRNHVHFSIPR